MTDSFDSTSKSAESAWISSATAVVVNRVLYGAVIVTAAVLGFAPPAPEDERDFDKTSLSVPQEQALIPLPADTLGNRNNYFSVEGDVFVVPLFRETAL